MSPVGFAFDSLEQVMEEAHKSAATTHDHPDAIKGAQAIASAIFWARHDRSRDYIKTQIQEQFGYDLSFTLDQIRPFYTFNKSCPGSVPQAIKAFLESSDFEDAIRKAVSLGGESTAIACMTGGIAQAFYKSIPEHLIVNARRLLKPSLLQVIDTFAATFDCQR